MVLSINVMVLYRAQRSGLLTHRRAEAQRRRRYTKCEKLVFSDQKKLFGGKYMCLSILSAAVVRGCSVTNQYSGKGVIYLMRIHIFGKPLIPSDTGGER